MVTKVTKKKYLRKKNAENLKHYFGFLLNFGSTTSEFYAVLTIDYASKRPPIEDENAMQLIEK